MIKIISIFLVSVTILTGCASASINLNDPDVRRAISSVEYYESVSGLSYDIVDSVSSRYCASDQASITKGGNITKEGSLTEMKYLASDKGANGLANVMCQTDGVHFPTNCNNSIVCFGDAIKLKMENESD